MTAVGNTGYYPGREWTVGVPAANRGCEMSDLIERLEKATGPDRELANEALLACGWTIHEYGPGPDRARIWQDPDSKGEDYLDGEQPHPLASFDAARGLVPDGFYWLVSEGRSRPNEPLGGAQVFRPNYLVEPIAQAEHESAIIALCIAALKARALCRERVRNEPSRRQHRVLPRQRMDG